MVPHKMAVNVILLLIISSIGESYWQLKRPAIGKYVQSKQKVVDSLSYQISLAHSRNLIRTQKSPALFSYSVFLLLLCSGFSVIKVYWAFLSFYFSILSSYVQLILKS